MDTPTSNGLDTGDGFFGFLDDSQHLKVTQNRDVIQNGGFWSGTGATDYNLSLNLPSDLASYSTGGTSTFTRSHSDQADARTKLRARKPKSLITVPRGRAEDSDEGGLSYEFETSPALARMRLVAPTHTFESRDELTDPPPAYTEAEVPSHPTPHAPHLRSPVNEVFSSSDIEPHRFVPEYRPVPNAAESANFIRNHFFPTANVSIDEHATATTVMNEFGGVTVIISTPETAQHSGQSGEVYERQNSTQPVCPALYIDEAGALNITGGTYVTQTYRDRRY